MIRQPISVVAANEDAKEGAKPSLMTRLSRMFRRSKHASLETYPLTSSAKALIANLMAMR